MGIFERKFEVVCFWLYYQTDAIVIWMLMVLGTAGGSALVFLLPHMNWILAILVGLGSFVIMCVLCLLTILSVPKDGLIVRIFGPPFWICGIYMLCAYMIAISLYPEYYVSS